MTKIQDENYYQINGWMINRLKLKGVELSIYSIIYGFSQDGESEYTGGIQYLCDFCGGVSKPTVIKALKDLTEKQYIIKNQININGVVFNRYKVNLPVVKKFYSGGKEILPEAANNFNSGSKETLPNNKNYNENYNQNNNKRFTPPTLEEVKAYCIERQNNVDAQKFVDYYTANGWQVGRNKMKDWKAAVRNWERNNFSNGNQKRGANGVLLDDRKTDELDGIL